LVRTADQMEYMESGMIRVAMTYRLCSPHRFETVSLLIPSSLPDFRRKAKLPLALPDSLQLEVLQKGREPM
jgi:hypothetical protein